MKSVYLYTVNLSLTWVYTTSIKTHCLLRQTIDPVQCLWNSFFSGMHYLSMVTWLRKFEYKVILTPSRLHQTDNILYFIFISPFTAGEAVSSSSPRLELAHLVIWYESVRKMLPYLTMPEQLIWTELWLRLSVFY